MEKALWLPPGSLPQVIHAGGGQLPRHEHAQAAQGRGLWCEELKDIERQRWRGGKKVTANKLSSLSAFPSKTGIWLKTCGFQCISQWGSERSYCNCWYPQDSNPFFGIVVPCWALSGTGASSSTSGTSPAWWSTRGRKIYNLSPMALT